MTTGRIPSKFAASGDTTDIPAESAAGYVNWLRGYSADYEREIGQDSAAKPVERMQQNFLFGLLTENLKQWQDQCFPEWRGTSAGTTPMPYGKGACVNYLGGLYRAIKAVPADVLPTDVNYWEKILSVSEITALSPMPAGGGDASTELVSAAKDLNSFTSGTWEFKTAAIGSANIPENTVGILQSKQWTSGQSAGDSQAQMYTTVNGIVYVRGRSGSSWSAWQRLINLSDMVARGYISGQRAVDANTTLTNGLYFYTSSSTNIPEGADTTGQILVMAAEAVQSGTQLLISKGNNTAWMRSFVTNPSLVFTDWVKLADYYDIPAPVSYPKNTAINFDTVNEGTYYLNSTKYSASTGVKPTASDAGILTTLFNASLHKVQTFQSVTGKFYTRGTSDGGTTWSAWSSPMTVQTNLADYGILNSFSNQECRSDNIFPDQNFNDWSRWIVAGVTNTITVTPIQSDLSLGWTCRNILRFDGARPTGSADNYVYARLPYDLTSQNLTAHISSGVFDAREAFDVSFQYRLSTNASAKFGVSITWEYSDGSTSSTVISLSTVDRIRNFTTNYKCCVQVPANAVRIHGYRLFVISADGSGAITGAVDIGSVDIRRSMNGAYLELNLATGYDFNNLVTCGVYNFTNITCLNASTNKPPTTGGYLKGFLSVIEDKTGTAAGTTYTNVIQSFYGTNGEFWIRTFNGSNQWTPWKKVTFLTDLTARGIYGDNVYTGSVNLNNDDFRVAGRWWFPDGVTHGPTDLIVSNAYFFLEVMSFQGAIHQRLSTYANNGDSKVYTRYWDNTSLVWGAWQRLVNANEVYDNGTFDSCQYLSSFNVDSLTKHGQFYGYVNSGTMPSGISYQNVFMQVRYINRNSGDQVLIMQDMMFDNATYRRLWIYNPGSWGAWTKL